MLARPRHDVIAIGASLGGIEAISELLGRLPEHLPASVLVVLHRPAERISHLCEVLQRRCRLHVVVAHDGEKLRPGFCYLGEPSRHLTVDPDERIRLVSDHLYRGRTVDVLFNSLAAHMGPRTIGVVLSGELDDGADGLTAIKKAGGVALVQSPGEALGKGMPQNAIRLDGPVDLVGPVADLAQVIVHLTALRPAPA